MTFFAALLLVPIADRALADYAQIISVDQATFTVAKEGSQATVIQTDGPSQTDEAQRIASAKAAEDATGCEVLRQYSVTAGSVVVSLACPQIVGDD